MKRLIEIVLCLLMLLPVGGCSSNKEITNNEHKCINTIYDLLTLDNYIEGEVTNYTYDDNGMFLYVDYQNNNYCFYIEPEEHRFLYQAYDSLYAPFINEKVRIYYIGDLNNNIILTKSVIDKSFNGDDGVNFVLKNEKEYLDYYESLKDGKICCVSDAMQKIIDYYGLENMVEHIRDNGIVYYTNGTENIYLKTIYYHEKIGMNIYVYLVKGNEKKHISISVETSEITELSY